MQGVEDTLAVLRGEEDIKVRIFTPVGQLAFKQSLVPLATKVSHLHGKRIKQGTRRYELKVANSGVQARVATSPAPSLQRL